MIRWCTIKFLPFGALLLKSGIWFARETPQEGDPVARWKGHCRYVHCVPVQPAVEEKMLIALAFSSCRGSPFKREYGSPSSSSPDKVFEWRVGAISCDSFTVQDFACPRHSPIRAFGKRTLTSPNSVQYTEMQWSFPLEGVTCREEQLAFRFPLQTKDIERNPAAPAVFNRDGKAILGTFTASQFGLQLR